MTWRLLADSAKYIFATNKKGIYRQKCTDSGGPTGSAVQLISNTKHKDYDLKRKDVVRPHPAIQNGAFKNTRIFILKKLVHHTCVYTPTPVHFLLCIVIFYVCVSNGSACNQDQFGFGLRYVEATGELIYVSRIRGIFSLPNAITETKSNAGERHDIHKWIKICWHMALCDSRHLLH